MPNFEFNSCKLKIESDKVYLKELIVHSTDFEFQIKNFFSDYLSEDGKILPVFDDTETIEAKVEQCNSIYVHADIEHQPQVLNFMVEIAEKVAYPDYVLFVIQSSQENEWKLFFPKKGNEFRAFYNLFR